MLHSGVALPWVGRVEEENLRQVVSRVCAYNSPAFVDFVPRNCTNREWDTQRAEIHRCPLVMSDCGRLCTNGMCQTAVERLSGMAVAILGDSMARQAFFSLVATLRDQNHLLDVHSWSSWRYARFATDAAFTDGLEELSEFPKASGNWSGPSSKRREKRIPIRCCAEEWHSLRWSVAKEEDICGLCE
jgi:hypothetical protein